MVRRGQGQIELAHEIITFTCFRPSYRCSHPKVAFSWFVSKLFYLSIFVVLPIVQWKRLLRSKKLAQETLSLLTNVWSRHFPRMAIDICDPVDLQNFWKLSIATYQIRVSFQLTILFLKNYWLLHRYLTRWSLNFISISFPKIKSLYSANW